MFYLMTHTIYGKGSKMFYLMTHTIYGKGRTFFYLMTHTIYGKSVLSASLNIFLYSEV